MDWNTAINILANRQTVQDENGAEMVLNAAHTAFALVAEHCTTNTDGLGDWLENGDWDTHSATMPGPADVAQEWDDLGTHMKVYQIWQHRASGERYVVLAGNWSSSEDVRHHIANHPDDYLPYKPE